MKHYLCKYHYNWADESDFHGIELIDDTEREYRQEILNLIHKYQIDPEIELWFGTNESDYYSLSDIVNLGTVIAEETYDDIKNLVCEYDGTFGFIPDLRNEIECLFNDLDLDLEYDVKRNPDKLEKYELNEIQFYQELQSLGI